MVSRVVPAVRATVSHCVVREGKREQCRDERNQLCDLLAIERPVVKVRAGVVAIRVPHIPLNMQASSGATESQSVADEMASYRGTHIHNSTSRP